VWGRGREEKQTKHRGEGGRKEGNTDRGRGRELREAGACQEKSAGRNRSPGTTDSTDFVPLSTNWIIKVLELLVSAKLKSLKAPNNLSMSLTLCKTKLTMFY